MDHVVPPVYDYGKDNIQAQRRESEITPQRVAAPQKSVLVKKKTPGGAPGGFG
jgi:hypothetical protein